MAEIRSITRELIQIVTKTLTMIFKREREKHMLSKLRKEVCVCICMWGRGDLNHHRHEEETGENTRENRLLKT